jgi:hypothetical protein
MTATVISLTAFKLARLSESETREHVLRSYRDHITDWCGHDLACQIVSLNTGISERIVRNIIDAAAPLFGDRA